MNNRKLFKSHTAQRVGSIINNVKAAFIKDFRWEKCFLELEEVKNSIQYRKSATQEAILLAPNPNSFILFHIESLEKKYTPIHYCYTKFNSSPHIAYNYFSVLGFEQVNKHPFLNMSALWDQISAKFESLLLENQLINVPYDELVEYTYQLVSDGIEDCAIYAMLQEHWQTRLISTTSVKSQETPIKLKWDGSKKFIYDLLRNAKKEDFISKTQTNSDLANFILQSIEFKGKLPTFTTIQAELGKLVRPKAGKRYEDLLVKYRTDNE